MVKEQKQSRKSNIQKLFDFVTFKKKDTENIFIETIIEPISRTRSRSLVGLEFQQEL
jgi:hypothetical protein